jgi:hypothetical protein
MVVRAKGRGVAAGGTRYQRYANCDQLVSKRGAKAWRDRVFSRKLAGSHAVWRSHAIVNAGTIVQELYVYEMRRTFLTCFYRSVTENYEKMTRTHCKNTLSF